LFGALFLAATAWIVQERLAPLERWRDYLVVSLTNSALPFLCFAWAAAILPASYLAIINGMLPLWTAGFAPWLPKEPLTAGPVRALVTGFTTPLLGVLWGWLLLDEAVTLPMLAGVALVVAALALVLKTTRPG